MGNPGWILRVVISAWLTCALPVARAQATVVTYVLDDVWLLPDISHSGVAARQMTGTFQWTYEEGDFENGSGQYIELVIPWYGSGLPDLEINIDATSTEFVLPGNFHDLGLDLTLFLIEPLSPDQASVIDTTRSIFNIERGISYKGHVVSGSIVPSLDICPIDLNGDGRSDLADFSLLADCMSGPEQPLAPDCESADIDIDGDADLADFATLQTALGCP